MNVKYQHIRVLNVMYTTCQPFASILLEIHSKTFTKTHLQREHHLKLDRDLNPGLKAQLYSDFGDPHKYAGSVPGGACLSRVYLDTHDTLAPFMDKEVKMRGTLRLHWDSSYKETHHLTKTHGTPIFHALITTTNEVCTSNTTLVILLVCVLMCDIGTRMSVCMFALVIPVCS